MDDTTQQTPRTIALITSADGTAYFTAAARATAMVMAAAVERLREAHPELAIVYDALPATNAAMRPPEMAPARAESAIDRRKARRRDTASPYLPWRRRQAAKRARKARRITRQRT
jgi:hypothetical protein